MTTEPATIELDAAWAALTPQQREEVGMAAIAMTLAQMGFAHCQQPDHQFRRAFYHASLTLEDIVRRALVPGAVIPVPSLAAIGVAEDDEA